jgi:hypothetical protein
MVGVNRKPVLTGGTVVQYEVCGTWKPYPTLGHTLRYGIGGGGSHFAWHKFLLCRNLSAGWLKLPCCWEKLLCWLAKASLLLGEASLLSGRSFHAVGRSFSAVWQKILCCLGRMLLHCLAESSLFGQKLPCCLEEALCSLEKAFAIWC